MPLTKCPKHPSIHWAMVASDRQTHVGIILFTCSVTTTSVRTKTVNGGNNHLFNTGAAYALSRYPEESRTRYINSEAPGTSTHVKSPVISRFQFGIKKKWN